jgi:hypothetical protein
MDRSRPRRRGATGWQSRVGARTDPRGIERDGNRLHARTTERPFMGSGFCILTPTLPELLGAPREPGLLIALVRILLALHIWFATDAPSCTMCTEFPRRRRRRSGARAGIVRPDGTPRPGSRSRGRTSGWDVPRADDEAGRFEVFTMLGGSGLTLRASDPEQCCSPGEAGRASRIRGRRAACPPAPDRGPSARPRRSLRAVGPRQRERGELWPLTPLEPGGAAPSPARARVHHRRLRTGPGPKSSGRSRGP